MNMNTNQTESASTDQERKILLLMLLAQVCALHDSTPKTFIVHVLSLYERGILDYESIGFLFDLGLVPSTLRVGDATGQAVVAPSLSTAAVPQDTLDHASSTTPELSRQGGAIIPFEMYHANKMTTQGNEVFTGTTDATTTTSTTNSFTQTAPDTDGMQQRLQEVRFIREHLGRQESQSSQKSTPVDREQDPVFIPPWTVEHHPLSFSRYIRDFYPQSVLASGAFGQVFRATNKLDGVDYAIKKVVFSAKGYDTQQVDMVIREVQCLAKLDHPNVVRYYTSWLEPSWMRGSRSNHMSSTVDASSMLQDDVPYTTPHRMMGQDVVKKELERKLLMDVHRLVLTREEEREARNNILHSIRLQVQEKRKKAMAPLNHSWEECEEEEYEDDDDDDGTDCSDWTDNSSMDSDHPSSVKHAQEITRRHVHEKRTPFYKYQICLYIQMQLCHSSTLADWIRQRNHSMIRSSTDSSDLIDYHHHARPAFEIFRQILKGLVHVHSRGIIHRDLKPANIFAAEDGVFKIGDFGLSKLLHIFEDPIPCTEDTTRVLLLPPNNTEADISAVSAERGMIVNDLHTAGVGTASYAAPEQMKSSSYGPEADVFSLGLILLELFSFFSSEHERAVTFHDCRRGTVPSWMTWTYPEVSRLVLACTNEDPSLRPTASDIIHMEIFQETSSAEIYKAEIQSLRHELRRKEAEIQKLKQMMMMQQQDPIDGLNIKGLGGHL